MPLETEPCEGPCPVIDEVMEGSGNATTNATEAVGEEPAEEGKSYYDIAVYREDFSYIKSKHLGWHIMYDIFEKVNAKSITKTCGFSGKMNKWKMQMQTARMMLTQEVEREVVTLVRI